MHVENVTFHPDRYPTRDHYPFNLAVFHETKQLAFETPITLFVGENGTGKSTLLDALAYQCGIHVWREDERQRVGFNPYEDKLRHCISVTWTNGPVPGAYFGSSTFLDFARILDEWAAADPGQLKYWGGKSLLTQSHGQSAMSFFRARYQIKGIYLLDEPETALSARAQIEFLALIMKMGAAGHAQFIIATHSPLLLACPGAAIYSFDHVPVRRIQYEETEHYQIYKRFLDDREQYLSQRGICHA
jgi:predicted ATPase